MAARRQGNVYSTNKSRKAKRARAAKFLMKPQNRGWRFEQIQLQDNGVSDLG